VTGRHAPFMGRTIQGILSVHRQKVNFTGAG
jgi:hypothetical protein